MARRFVGPVVYVGAVTLVGFLASLAPSSWGPAMAMALVSPLGRSRASAKLAARLREEEKTEERVTALVAADLAKGDCRAAAIDAYRYRARASFSRIDDVCGPSPEIARSLFEEGRMEDAARAFERARHVHPDTRLEIDELTAYVLTGRGAVGAAALRKMRLRPEDTIDAGCLATAIEAHAGSEVEGALAALGDGCPVLRLDLTPVKKAPSAVSPNQEAARCALRPVPKCQGPGPYARDHLDPLPFVPPGEQVSSRADWLAQRDDTEGALALVEHELRGLGSATPLYAPEIRAAHEALVARLRGESPSHVRVRADCTEELRVPVGHPLFAQVEADRNAYDVARDEADRERLSARDSALDWGYRIAVLALDGKRAESYFTASSQAKRAPEPGVFRTIPDVTRATLLQRFSPEAAARALERADAQVREAAVAGSGSRLARRLHELGESGWGTLDVVGVTLPEGRSSLVTFSRYEARLDCRRRVARDWDMAPHCTALALVRALGARHRVARAVGDADTVRDSGEALDRLLSHGGGKWLTNQPQAIVLAHADRFLAEAREP
ncbi:MAG: hypothetical protein IPK71_00475 [Myxococcales bacterium]|nr:hypothetical protein [Myxococcales bacterium]